MNKKMEIMRKNRKGSDGFTIRPNVRNHPFIHGIFSIFSFSTKCDEGRRILSTTDNQAIINDWNIVGDDIYKSILSYAGTIDHVKE